LQVSHPNQLHVEAPAAHPAAAVHHGPADVAALGVATVLVFGVPLFAAFVIWRFFRWFFRVTR
jgi:hypothetical protein